MKRILIFLGVILMGCAAKKQAAELEAQPMWLKQKPVIKDYYTGVGSAKKTGTFQEYSSEAKKNALADLAQEISINISASSVLHTIENEQGLLEIFDQQINIQAEDYLEGFEPVDTYENENTYWILYRIDKKTYQEKKNHKKHLALQNAKAKYKAGLQSQLVNQPKEALLFYLQGMQALDHYIAEETSVEINNESIDIGNELYSRISNIVNGLKINEQTNFIRAKRGSSVEDPLPFLVLYNNTPAEGIPVEFSYSGGYLQTDRGLSDKNGLVELIPGQFNSQNEQERITASINLKQIAQQAVDNLFIRGLLVQFKTEPAVVYVEIIPQKISLDLEAIWCDENPCGNIMRAFQQKAIRRGFSIDIPVNSDHRYKLTFAFKEGELAANLVSVYLDGILSLFDNKDVELWVKNISNIKGVGNTSAEAKEKAFEKFAKDLERIYFDKGMDAIKY